MAEMLRDAGYATAIFGKWHLGAQPYSQPQNKGFDEFYGIPPAVTWDAFLMIPQGRQTKTLDIPLDMGPQIVEARRGEPLKAVKPYTAEVRREIDWELVDRGIDFMQAPESGGQAVLPLSADLQDALSESAVEALRGPVAHRPVRRFADGRRCHRGPDARRARRTRPRARHHRRLRLRQWSRRTRSARIRRRHAGHGLVRTLSRRARRRQRRLDPHRRHHPLAGPDPAAILLRHVLDHGFFPDLRTVAGGKVPDDRPIDGVDQSDLLLGASDSGRRDHLLTFVGPDLVAARWKQFRAYFADVAPGRSGWGGATLMGGVGASAAPMNGYPKVFNIESDPREEHNIGEMYEWVIGPVLKAVEQYKASLAKHPNPPAANMTRF